MEFNPGGLFLVFLVVLLLIFFLAFIAFCLIELLVALKVFRKANWPLRIVMTICLVALAYYFLVPDSQSSAKDIVTVTTAIQNCNSISKERLYGSWAYWNVSHSKKDTITLEKGGHMEWSERNYSDWELFCDTLIVRQEGKKNDSIKILEVSETNVAFRTCSFTDTSWHFSAEKIYNKK